MELSKFLDYLSHFCIKFIIIVVTKHAFYLLIICFKLGFVIWWVSHPHFICSEIWSSCIFRFSKSFNYSMEDTLALKCRGQEINKKNEQFFFFICFTNSFDIFNQFIKMNTICGNIQLLIHFRLSNSHCKVWIFSFSTSSFSS